MPLTIVANIHAVPGKADLVRTELTKLVGPTREEAGCIQYDLHMNNDDPNHFLFYENWESRDLWQAHMQAPHLAAYGTATQGAVENFVLHEMEKIA